MMAPSFLPRAALPFLLALAAASAVAEPAEDHRAWQHGVDLLQVGERLLVVWGSAGNPPRPNLGADWQHDIYYAWLEQPAAQDGAPPVPRLLVARPEAQEPPSAAINAKGTILVTSEDGNDGINQHAGLWDSGLRVLRGYPFSVRRGGHSGHVAAMGDRFLVAYGNGWAEKGGFLDRGTGRDIHARIVENDGSLRKEVAIATGQRDSWPLVAGSDRNWLVVWQRYPGLTLHSALIDASGRVVKQRRIIDGLPLRYAFDVGFSPQLGAYVIAGSSGAAGFVALVSLAGETVHLQRQLPPMASESRIVLGLDGSQPIGVYPVNPRGFAVIRFSAAAVALDRVIDHPHAWDYAGTTGAFVAPGRILFATLTRAGIKLIPLALQP